MKKIFRLKYDSTKKYFRLDILEDVYEGMDFKKYIKNGNFTFTKDAGMTDADCIGSTLGNYFFSEKFISKLFENSICDFDKYQLKFDADFTFKNKYFYIEPKYNIPKIQNKNIFAEPDINRYCKMNCLMKTDIISLGTNIYFLYADISNIGKKDLFGVEGTEILLISEKLKDIIQKGNFKNLKTEEVQRLG